jgi:hypothetical protein
MDQREMMKAHRVINGPLEDEDGLIICVCLVEDDGELYDEEIYFESMAEAIVFANHFKTSIEPIELNYGRGEDH